MQEKKVPFTLTQILSKLKGTDDPWACMGMDQNWVTQLAGFRGIRNVRIPSILDNHFDPYPHEYTCLHHILCLLTVGADN